MSSGQKRLTIKLDVDDHTNLKIMSIKKGNTLRKTVETLIENYVYGSKKLPNKFFINNKKNIKLVKEIYEKTKSRIDEEIKTKDFDKKRNRTITNLAKGLISKYILNNYSYDFFKNMERNMLNFYWQNYKRNNPTRNKAISFNITDDLMEEIRKSLKNKISLNGLQRNMEVLFYAYAFNHIDLEDKYFERKSLSIRIDNDLYEGFENKRYLKGKNRTIQKVGETLIKQKLNNQSVN